MSYWDRTDDYLGRHGGRGPLCPSCGEEMFAADDHGRFSCFCGGGTLDTVTGMTLPPPRPIPQVDASTMTDAEKALVPCINRLHQPGTAAETRFLALAARRPLTLKEDDPELVQWEEEYAAAKKALDEERAQLPSQK